jgi:diadenosine tetraphosphate (Ap4A) HIT family hydrolase
MVRTMSSCPLCSPRAEQVFFQGKLIIGIWADPAVTPGHAVLVTRRHVTDWFAASPAEQQELMASLATVRDAILEQQLPDGFNIGIHIGAAAGQDVPHLHVDVIPRYRQAVAASDAARGAPAQKIPAQKTPAQKTPVLKTPAPAAPTEPAEPATTAEFVESAVPAGATPPRQPRKHTDAWSGQAPMGEPVLDRVERELEAKARRQPKPASDSKVTQLPGTTRSTPELAPAARSEPSHEQASQHHGLSAVPAPADAPEAESTNSDEPEEASSAYTRAPSFRSLDDDYGQTHDYDDDDDLYDDEGETKLPGRGKKWVVLLVLLLLAGGGGYAAYWAKTSPYIGEPPAHLKIDSKQQKPAPTAAAPTGAKVRKPELPAAPRGRSALAPVRTIPGTTTPTLGATPGAPAPGAPASTSSEYDRLMAQASELLKQRKRRAAYKLLDKALEVQPGGWQALQHLAWRDAKAGRLGRALKRARAALKANKDAPYANLVLGVAMHERGRTAAARAGYSKYIARCKGCPEVGEIRRVLRSLGEED